MSWWYNQTVGSVFEKSGAEGAALKAAVWTQEHDPIPGQWLYGPFGTQAEAEAVKAAHPPITAVVGGAIGSGIDQLGVLLLRLAEAALGIVLLAIAFQAILKQTTGV